MADGRISNGGVRLNSGRKSKAEELGLAATLEKCFTKEDRERCIERLATDCQSEDFHTRHESRKLLLAYTFGKPTEKHEHSGPDGDGLKIVVEYRDATP